MYAIIVPFYSCFESSTSLNIPILKKIQNPSLLLHIQHYLMATLSIGLLTSHLWHHQEMSFNYRLESIGMLQEFVTDTLALALALLHTHSLSANIMT